MLYNELKVKKEANSRRDWPNLNSRDDLFGQYQYYQNLKLLSSTIMHLCNSRPKISLAFMVKYREDRLKMISYEPLFITLIKKKMKLNDLKDEGVISSATQSKFRKNESVTLTTIKKVCIFLDVPIHDVVEIISEELN